LIKNRKTAGLGLYVAFLDGIPKELFAELRDAFNDFTKTRNWHMIKEAAAEGYRRAKSYTSEMVHFFQTGKKKQQMQWAKDKIEKRLLDKIKSKNISGE
jgi:hypothetical protein